MEDMVPAVTLPFRIGNSICDSPVEITRVKLFADTAGLLADPMDTDAGTEREVVLVVPMDEGGDGNGLEEVRTAPRSDDDDAVSIEAEPVGSPGSVVSDCSSIASIVEDFPELGAETGMAVFMDAVRRMVAPVELIAGPALAESSASGLTVDAGESGVAAISLAEPVMLESSSSGSGGRRVFSVDYMPLWGYTSICGRRPEMEDAVTAVTWFFEIPLWMLTGDHVIDGFNPSLIHLPAHFFGVYDGHGGSHVANYCRDRVHVALVERLSNLKDEMAGNCEKDWQKLWERAFIDCFQKVDDEVGGKVSRIIAENAVDLCGENSSRPSTSSDPVAPETVGSTAVVAVICSSHIIVANCGDSRAVLCRGKQPVPLSSDHKPNREDEYARIEAEGGKVIQWNGHRVFGVLAMSRSIGDRYLKPWIIPVPEVTIVPRMREDECLILASDGLWDVMTNEEACDAARRRILLWHKKNGVTAASAHRGEEANPAAQAAADYLSKLALQKGSKDNITVIVVDLKAQRKFKSRS